jgi:hypothetical protein
MKSVLLLSALFITLIACKKDKETTTTPPPPTEPEEVASKYDFTTEGGMTLAVHKEEARRGLNATLGIKSIKENMALFQATVSSTTHSKFNKDTIWVEDRGAHIKFVDDPGGYHPGSIVVGNIVVFYDSVKNSQPALLLNHLARQYYGKYMSAEAKTSLAAHFTTVAGKYKAVYGTNGTKLVRNKVSDASKSVIDYFAENTEAYLHVNNFYPFDYHELERYDAAGFNALKDAWGARTFTPNAYGITLPPASLKQSLNYLITDLDTYYRKYIDAEGFPIVASRFVADSALVQTKKIVIQMLTRIPDAKAAMLTANFRVGVIGAYENVTDLPENRKMNEWWPGTDWDARGRGYGATEFLPVMSCGEENIIKIPGYTERYPFESIMVHEFAHNVDFGLRKARAGFTAELLAAFNYAKTNGLWAGTYSMENDAEYFAEGVQAWFDTCNMYVNINGVSTKLKTREQLRTYDTRLYDLLSKIMPTEKLTGYHFTFE